MRSLRQPRVPLPKHIRECRVRCFTALVALGLSACVSLPRTPQTAVQRKVAPAGFPAHIAVLPLSNATSDAEGPLIVRAFAIRKLSRELGYIVPTADEADNALGSRDLIWAGHPQGRHLLDKQDSAIVATWLGVEGLLHAELTR